MGIVNVTPDSFSDGGKYFKPEEAVRRAANIAAEGAAIVDVGGESTRPGAEPIDWDEEWARVEPVIRGISRADVACTISVDTYHPETAERAVAAGAGMINCVYAESIPEMLKICTRTGAELVSPAECAGLLRAAGRLDRAYLDPMIGFGTTREEDLNLLRSIPALAAEGRVLVGASRKRIVQRLSGVKTVGKNLGGSIAVAVWAALNGASVVRVHDVKETVAALKTSEFLKRGK